MVFSLLNWLLSNIAAKQLNIIRFGSLVAEAHSIRFMVCAQFDSLPRIYAYCVKGPQTKEAYPSP